MNTHYLTHLENEIQQTQNHPLGQEEENELIYNSQLTIATLHVCPFQ